MAGADSPQRGDSPLQVQAEGRITISFQGKQRLWQIPNLPGPQWQTTDKRKMQNDLQAGCGNNARKCKQMSNNRLSPVIYVNEILDDPLNL